MRRMFPALPRPIPIYLILQIFADKSEARHEAISKLLRVVLRLSQAASTKSYIHIEDARYRSDHMLFVTESYEDFACISQAGHLS